MSGVTTSSLSQGRDYWTVGQGHEREDRQRVTPLDTPLVWDFVSMAWFIVPEAKGVTIGLAVTFTTQQINS